MSILSRRTILLSLTAAFSAAVLPLRQTYATKSKEHLVEIRDFEFFPENQAVRIGDRITWINRDIAPHTATALDGSWDTGELALNQSMTLTVRKDMVSDYLCLFHPHMKATLTVIS